MLPCLKTAGEIISDLAAGDEDDAGKGAIVLAQASLPPPPLPPRAGTSGISSPCTAALGVLRRCLICLVCLM
jgi:hypothetical protein